MLLLTLLFVIDVVIVIVIDVVIDVFIVIDVVIVFDIVVHIIKVLFACLPCTNILSHRWAFSDNSIHVRLFIKRGVTRFC